MKVSVVIVTSGVSNYILSCLSSVLFQGYPPEEVIVIRNPIYPIDDSILEGMSNKVKVITPQKNIFYCQALNIGIHQSRGEYILCLNDDVILEKDFLNEALLGFSISDRIGMVSGKIMRPDKKTIDSTGLFLSIWRTPKERGYHSIDTGRFDRSGFIFGVNGAVAFYRRVMLEDVKIDNFYFDPCFRIFYEDLDISWRAQKRGWKAYYTPKAVAYHIRGATVRSKQGQGRSFSIRFLTPPLVVDLLKNRYITILRNETPFGLFLHLPAIVFYDMLIWILVLVYHPVVLRICLKKFTLLGKILKKREKI